MALSRKIQFFTVSVFLMMSFFPAYAIAIQSRYGEPTVDVALEKRLEKPSQYRTKKTESLSFVAHFLYGHYSWWIKLRAQNPALKHYGEDDNLPVGTQIAYLAPEVGDIYEVKPNDWLIRIAEWKYGDSDLWQDLFRKNMASITNPDLIHPGDKLVLGIDGTVHNASTGKTLIEGTAELAKTTPDVARAVASETETVVTGFWAWSHEQPYFFFGFFTGVAILLAMLFYALFQQFLITPAVFDPSARKQQKALEDEEEEDEQSALRQNLQGYPHEFKRRALEDPTFDKSLMRQEEPEIDLRPSYNRLFGRLKGWKNYLNIKRKK